MNITQAAKIEIFKVKRKGLLPLIIGGGLLSILVSYLPSIETKRFDWPELFSASQFIFNQILFLLGGYISGMMFAGEYENNTMDCLAASPIKKSLIVYGKVLAAFFLLFCSVVCAIVLAMAAGAFAGCENFSGVLFGRYLAACFAALALHTAFLPLYMLIGELGKKTLYPSIAGMGMIIFALLFLPKGFSVYFPPCVPALALLSILGNNSYVEFFRFGGVPRISAVQAVTVSAGLAVITSVIMLARRRER